MKKIILILGVALGLVSCGEESAITAVSPHLAYDLSARKYTENFEELPTQSINTENKRTTNKVELGHHLYFDTRLSLEGNNSCNSCHNLATYGVDNKATSTGDAGGNGDRNSPTVLNAALHASQFWDGRAKDVEEQAGMPILNPVEMAIPNEEFLVTRLKGIPAYVKAFEAAYPKEEEALTYQNLQKAIGVFERELITPSRFDEFLAGNDSALSLQEKKGFISFNLVGCVSCHSGAVLGGQQLQKFGLFEEYVSLTGSEHVDYGKYQSSGEEKDKFIFKVPSLRNIEKTAPYFHDGSVDQLEDAVQIMARTQLGKTLSSSEIENITAFLNSLTGEVPAKYKQAPKMY
ncbi:MAG: cytochrome-c peroxidase [Flavobacteriales bacterium]|jgi:cytochrome c peroxidase|nr:cytochrome-c peroxidase [Flavobacteriales bacterium]